jgi:hypothetical protein
MYEITADKQKYRKFITAHLSYFIGKGHLFLNFQKQMDVKEILFSVSVFLKKQNHNVLVEQKIITGVFFIVDNTRSKLVWMSHTYNFNGHMVTIVSFTGGGRPQGANPPYIIF